MDYLTPGVLPHTRISTCVCVCVRVWVCLKKKTDMNSNPYPGIYQTGILALVLEVLPTNKAMAAPVAEALKPCALATVETK